MRAIAELRSNSFVPLSSTAIVSARVVLKMSTMSVVHLAKVFTSSIDGRASSRIFVDTSSLADVMCPKALSEYDFIVPIP